MWIGTGNGRGDVTAAQKAWLNEHGLDASIAISPENVTYVSGMTVPSQSLLRWRHSAVICPREGDVRVFTVDMEESTVRSALPEVPVTVWSEFKRDAMPVLAKCLQDLGLERATIGIETNYLPARDHTLLQELLPSVTWVSIDEFLDDLRMIKTAEEVALLSWLSSVTEAAIDAALAGVGAGDTEMDLATILLGELYRSGVDAHELLIVASGERSQFPNVGPTERVLTRGDVVRVEVFGVKQGYHAGVCRTGVVQSASDEVEGIWRNLADCRSMLLDEIKPGVTGESIYFRFIQHFAELGYQPIDFVGHGIGVNLHEVPYLAPHESRRLEEGMVLGMEPLVYIPGRFGVQIKDMIAVTSDGCELLSAKMDLKGPQLLG